MKKVKRVLALAVAVVMTAVMAISPVTAVSASAAPSKYVKSLKVSKSKVTLEAGKKATVNATVKVKGSASKKVTVKLTKANKKVVKSVKVGKPNKKGVSKLTITAANVSKKSTTTIKVVTKAKNSKNKTITKNLKVTVTPKKAAPAPAPSVVAVTSVTVTAAKTTLTIGEKTTVAAVVLPANATNKTVTWSSSNTGVATVDANGLVTAVASGTARITATAGGKTGFVDLQINPRNVAGVVLDAEELKMTVNESSQLKATITPLDATNKVVKWTSSDTSVAKVSADGLVTAIKAGEATITVTTEDGNLTAKCKVTVVDSTVGFKTAFTIDVTNANKTYSDATKKDYVLLTGQDANVRVRLVKNGEGYGNQQVKAAIVPLYGSDDDLYAIESSAMNKFYTTDADGYITVPLSLTTAHYDATAVSGEYQSYKLIVTLSGDALVTESATISFGTVSLQSAYVDDLVTLSEMGENAVRSNQRSTYSSVAKNGAFAQEYVVSQQVSSDAKDHSVTMVAYPVLTLPAKASEVQTGAYLDEDVARKSGPYSVYNDETNTTTTTIVNTVPAGLEWATLVFNSIELSDYTKLAVRFYKKDTNILIEEQVLTAETLKEDANNVQIPVKDDYAVTIVIALISEGQVNDEQNEGYDLAKIIGEWATDNDVPGSDHAIEGAITWEKDAEYKRSATDNSNLTFAQAQEYITDTQYLNETLYTYSYTVPTFPHVGNAIIYVNEKGTNETKQYYTYYADNYKSSGEWQNANEIAPAGYYGSKAARISKDEAMNSVGTVTPSGNFVKVDSRVTGYTPLHATLDLTTLGVENVVNGNIYSFVQWAPIPTTTEITPAVDFYALAGQGVEVTAQLYDTNGNPVSNVSDATLEFTLDNGNAVDLKEFVVGTLNTKADATGKCVFTVRQTDDYDYLERLHATTPNYQVKFNIGNQTAVDYATIHWVTPGLYFKDKVDTDKGSGIETITFAGNKEVTQNMDRVVGDSWIFGLKLIGDLPIIDEMKNLAVDITGVDMEFTKTGLPNATVTSTEAEQKKGVYKMKSDEIGTAVVKGGISYETVTDDVDFFIYDEILGKESGKWYPNVGTGEATKVNAGITLNINWKEKGIQKEIISPLGTSLDVTTPTKAYVKVTDELGNLLQNKKVTYSVSGLGAINAVTDMVAYTNEFGLVAINLVAPGTDGTVTIECTVGDGEDVVAAKEIVYTDCGVAEPLTISSAKLSKVDDKAYVTVQFSAAIKKETLNNLEFFIDNTNDASKDYDIKNVVFTANDAGVVVIEMTTPDILDANVSDLRLTVKPYEDKGMTYQLMDINKRVLSENNQTSAITKE